MKEQYRINSQPKAKSENIIIQGNARFTILTEFLVRIEYDESGHFCDRPTQIVLNRDFHKTEYESIVSVDGTLTIETAEIVLTYLGGEFNSGSLKVWVKNGLNNERSTWHYGDSTEFSFGGTCRTLDAVDGAADIGKGLFSGEGWEILDDSKSLLINDDGWLCEREYGCTDLYVFGYFRRYLEGLKAFYKLTGKQPMIPRYAFGNWWSRYYAYTQKEYLDLMDNFRTKNIPFSVAVIDMDWHLTEIDPKYGIGWTGFTWNKELFPDHVAFMKELHEKGMSVSLNTHPADGIRAYEELYPNIAKACGIDPETGRKVDFDLTDPEFIEKYFDYVAHELEKEGVDFWWLDWQQGEETGIKNLDPLWVINHYHYLDSIRDNKRGMIFSRYAGPGSHRYPIGFSGDTYITWESLDFQPYFTYTATNIGYGFWSHDIGGHMHGVKDDELYGRWVQFGVFSPINRLHSTKNEFNGKEPWRFNTRVEIMTERYLRLRHEMVPYLYSMCRRAYKDDIPMCLPLYYREPDNLLSYQIGNEYYFGSEMLCAPITNPSNNKRPAGRKVLLPKGLWFDFFTGMPYVGGRLINVFREIEDMPVFVKAGGIVPMTSEIFDGEINRNPEKLIINVFPGADNTFTLYEDDGISTDYENGAFVLTDMTYCDSKGQFTVSKARGEVSLIPGERSYEIRFMGICEEKLTCSVEGYETSYNREEAILTVSIPKATTDIDISVFFGAPPAVDTSLKYRKLFNLLNTLEMNYDDKTRIMDGVRDHINSEPDKVDICTLTQIDAIVDDKDYAGAIKEIIASY